MLVSLWLSPIIVMLCIRVPWLVVAGAERFFVPFSELEFYLGQSTKYLSILSIMLFIMFKFSISFRDIGIWTTFRLALGDILHGGVFALFYILITWVASIFFIPFIPERAETVFFNLFYGYVIPVDKMLELISILNPWIYAVYMTTIPAIVEEMYFRGYSINLLRNFSGNLWIVNLLQASLFSALHWYRGLLAGILPMFIFGILFGFLTIKNNFRLTSAITGHLIVNMLSISLYLRGLEMIQ
ncbi:MAG: CPBP family intramembrane glutamic endopeptidase [Nitrososphaerota archaeon]|nr:CPBP family intramembrane glutamic endopeptidase [Nitrososphaerota archaeon]